MSDNYSRLSVYACNKQHFSRLVGERLNIFFVVFKLEVNVSQIDASSDVVTKSNKLVKISSAPCHFFPIALMLNSQSSVVYFKNIENC